MGKPKRDSDAIVDTAADAARRGGRSFKQRQRGQSDGVRDRNRAVQDKDGELGEVDVPAINRPPTEGGGGSNSSGGDGVDHDFDIDEVADQIAHGHAFQEHVKDDEHFPGVESPEQFAIVIADAMRNGLSRTLARGRSAYWHGGAIVIRDPFHLDGGTAYRPDAGFTHFLTRL